MASQYGIIDLAGCPRIDYPERYKSTVVDVAINAESGWNKFTFFRIRTRPVQRGSTFSIRHALRRRCCCTIANVKHARPAPAATFYVYESWRMCKPRPWTGNLHIRLERITAERYIEHSALRETFIFIVLLFWRRGVGKGVGGSSGIDVSLGGYQAAQTRKLVIAFICAGSTSARRPQRFLTLHSGARLVGQKVAAVEWRVSAVTRCIIHWGGSEFAVGRGR